MQMFKKRGRLFPLEPSQNTYYSVHRSAFYRLLAWSWAKDRENIVYMRMAWSNSNWGISSFLEQRCESAAGQRLKHRCRLVYNCAQIWALENLDLSYELAPVLQCQDVSWAGLQYAQPPSSISGAELCSRKETLHRDFHPLKGRMMIFYSFF